MHILLPYKVRTDILRTAKQLLEARGHTCVPYAVRSAAKIAEKWDQEHFDAALSSESAALAGLPADARNIYLASDFFCPDRHIAPSVQTCLIPHEELSFDFITRGVRDTNVRVCGVPLREEFCRTYARAECCRALGLSQMKTIFVLLGDTVPASVLRAAVRAVRTFCPSSQILLLGSSETRRKSWLGAFADAQDVFVTDVEMDISLALSASDAVVTPALSPFVCAAARRGKIVTLLHSAAVRARENAAFLDRHGAAFRGKTAADAVSYACRLLDSDRLHANMIAAQESVILPDAQARFIRAVEQRI